MHAILNLFNLFRPYSIFQNTKYLVPDNRNVVILSICRIRYPEHRFYEIEVDLFRKESRMQYEHDELP